MNIEVTIKKVANTKNNKYDLTLKTYKETISGIFEKGDLRYLIQAIDNEIE